MNKELVGAIIAAGRGTRAKPLSINIPKSLLPICNKPIIVHQIEYMKEIEIKDIYIVVGYLKDQIINYLGNGSKLGVNIKYIEQKSPDGSGHAVGLLEPYIKQNFLLFLGDICIKVRGLKEKINSLRINDGVTYLTCKRENDLKAVKKNFTIHLNKNGEVIKVIEKPKTPVTNLKGCGVYIFSPKIFDAIRITPRSGIRNEYEITHAVDNLIKMHHKVLPLEIIDWDMNITTPEDLYYYNFLWLRTMELPHLIGKNVKIPEGTVIENSIIGDNVKINKAANIINSIIFPNETVDTTEEVRDVLLFGNRMYLSRGLI